MRIRITTNALRLNKAIYGLKQSGKAWNAKIDNIVRQFDFKPIQNEPCLYIKYINERIIFIAIYIDIITGIPSINDIEDVRSKLGNTFKLVDKGQISYFHSWEIERTRDTGPIAGASQNT